jgi:hypothetical protein
VEHFRSGPHPPAEVAPFGQYDPLNKSVADTERMIATSIEITHPLQEEESRPSAFFGLSSPGMVSVSTFFPSAGSICFPMNIFFNAFPSLIDFPVSPKPFSRA